MLPRTLRPLRPLVHGARTCATAHAAQLSAPADLRAQYAALVRRGRIQHDAQQACAVEVLHALEARLHGYCAERMRCGMPVWEVYRARVHGHEEERVALCRTPQEAAAVAREGGARGKDARDGVAREGGGQEQEQEQELERPRCVRALRRDAATGQLAPHSGALRVPRGVYLWGDVGVGKSLLMDLLFSASCTPRKRRLHFHDFMLEVHSRVHAWKQRTLQQHGRSMHVQLAPEHDALVQVARSIADESWLLCFDEFQVTDVADALVMRKLFGEMWLAGCVMVTTSNRPPGELYAGGLNRHYFLPFIHELEARCKVLHLRGSADYRRSPRLAAADAPVTAARPPAAFVALADRSAAWRQLLRHAAWLGEVADACRHVTGDAPASDATASASATHAACRVPVMMGRELVVPAACGSVCWMPFDALCGAATGAADYRALSSAFRTVVITGVPRFTLARADALKRFMVLVDQLYERGVTLVCHAAEAGGIDGLFAEFEEMYAREPQLPAHQQAPADPASDTLVLQTEAALSEIGFACRRAASRLHEMTDESSAYARRAAAA